MRANYIILILLLISNIPIVTATGETHPSERFGHKMLYDPITDRVLLFGGVLYDNSRETRYNDLWSYDFESEIWLEITSGSRPSPRNSFAWVYLEGHSQILLYGGDTNQGKSSETWIYDLTENRWFCVDSELEQRPPGLSEITMAYDSINDKVILFGGMGENSPGSRDQTYNELWVFSFEPLSWTRMSPDNNPLPQYGAQMVYDEASSSVLMYPGHWNEVDDPTNHGYGDDIWEYQYQSDSWVMYEASSKPVGRYWANVNSVGAGKIILFGGNRATSMDDTWIYDYPSNTWSQIHTQNTPPDRMCSSMAYDPTNDQLVMFGGFQEGMVFLDDTWIFDFETENWLELGEATDMIDSESEQSIPGYSYWSIFLGSLSYIIVKKLESKKSQLHVTGILNFPHYNKVFKR